MTIDKLHANGAYQNSTNNKTLANKGFIKTTDCILLKSSGEKFPERGKIPRINRRYYSIF